MKSRATTTPSLVSEDTEMKKKVTGVTASCTALTYFWTFMFPLLYFLLLNVYLMFSVLMNIIVTFMFIVTL